MSAEVLATTGPFRFQAWCTHCADGLNGSRDSCETWATIHNNRRHPIEETK